jgi:ATP-dependent protease HslVU (ClpYQ) peptidase subunit
VTSIAWDGSTLAADSQITVGSTKYQGTKIFRLSDGSLFGGAGDGSTVNRARDYLDGKRKTRPKMDGAVFIRIMPDKEIRLYAGTWDYEVLSDRFVAVGSGADFALGAMECGKGAVQAIEIACRRDAASGLPVESLSLLCPGPANPPDGR